MRMPSLISVLGVFSPGDMMVDRVLRRMVRPLGLRRVARIATTRHEWSRPQIIGRGRPNDRRWSGCFGEGGVAGFGELVMDTPEDPTSHRDARPLGAETFFGR
jgi:hypothetical protein